MDLKVGAILEGTVSGIANFGAFVTLENGQKGLVHISEIANSYVENVRDHLSEGMKIKVKVLELGQGGKINLSIKKALVSEPAKESPLETKPQPIPEAPPKTENEIFEDRLKRFMQESNSRINENKMYKDLKNRRRR
ncbi:MAG: S1 RNA-binding domain-containing protein [Candidatus Scatomorpha sp.]|jgi:S1 RNA binding domain protein